MLTLNDAQWRELQARDQRQFDVAVCDQFLADRPELLEDPGRSVILERMQRAHIYAVRIGFTSTPHIIHLMYLAADGPTMLDDPVIETYLRKPGATPEQRFDDLLAVMRKKLEGNH